MLVRKPPVGRLAALVEFMSAVCSETVIVDTGSDPDQLAAMRSWINTAVIEREWRDDFSWARNEGLAECKGDWTIVLDPDELPSEKMLRHIRMVDTGEVDASHESYRPTAIGWLYWTRNWWGGIYGPEMDYHWHCRLFKTGSGLFYRPVHELVALKYNDKWVGEDLARDTPLMGRAPVAACLIHSKEAEAIAEADRQYATIGEAKS